MIKIPPEYFEQFYCPLVGNEAAIDNLRTVLAEAVNTHEGDFDDTNPYDRLQAGFSMAIRQAADHIVVADKFRPKRQRSSVRANGVFGGRLIIRTLRTLDEVYSEYSSVPQQSVRVAQSTNRAVGYVYGMAFSGKLVGAINTEAARIGQDPRSLLKLPKILGSFLVHPNPKGANSRQMFKIEVDDDGQLDIRPRYRRRGKIVDRQCPATFAAVGEVQTSALFTLVRSLGEVAVSEIFPHHFEIITQDQA